MISSSIHGICIIMSVGLAVQLYIHIGFYRLICLGFPALTPWTIMDDFMREDIAVNTKVVVAYGAFVSAAGADSLDCALFALPGFLRGYGREWVSTGKAAGAN